MFIADGTYRVERGSTTNRFGDEVDAPEQIVARGVPGVISERRRLRGGKSERSEGNELMSVLVVSGRFRPGLDVQQNDRIVCEQNIARTFTVDDVPMQPGASIMHSDTVVELKRVTQ